jgi:biopolymer transport protein ExbD
VSFVFECPHCRTKQSAVESLIGRRIRCPSCGQLVEVTAPVAVGAVAGSESLPAWKDEPIQAQSAPRFIGAPEPASDEEPPPPVQLGKKSRLSDGEMDMTPMVDVVFNLLIFFMVTCAFSLQKSIEVPKPQQTDQPSTTVLEVEENPEYVTIMVDENGTFQVITPEWDRECPGEQDLLVQLREARQGGPAGPATKVLVKAHGDAKHERVVMALDSATAAEYEEVQLTVYEDEI